MYQDGQKYTPTKDSLQCVINKIVRTRLYHVSSNIEIARSVET